MANTFDYDLGKFTEFLGLTVTHADGDLVVAEWEATPDLHQPHGILHGGAHCAVVESLASLAGWLWLGDRGYVVGVHNSVDFLRAVSEGRLVSTTTPVHRGRSQQVWDVVTTDEAGRTVARGSVRLQNMEHRRD